MIWITAGVLIFGVLASGDPSVPGIVGIYCIAKIGDRLLGDKTDEPVKTAAMPEGKASVFVPPAGKHLISTDGAKQIRNLLLRHHNMMQTDQDYTDSDMAKQTVAIIATLNVYLKGKT